MSTAPRMGLTFLVGTLIGGLYLISKPLLMTGLAPVELTSLQFAGAGSILVIVILATGQRLPISRTELRYAFVAGVFGAGVPYMVGYTAMRELSAGMMTLVATTAPVMTLALESLLERRVPAPTKALGIGVGAVGILMAIWPQLTTATGEAGPVGIALLAPLSLAAGNIYRKRYWPDGSSPLGLAAATVLLQLPILAAVAFLTLGRGPMPAVIAEPGLLGLLVSMSAMVYLLFFILQRFTDPVAFSQIGYFIAATGIVGGTLLLGEEPGANVITGTALLIVGLYLTNREPPPGPRPQATTVN